MNKDSLTIEWWKRVIIYELYVKSFKDSNSDGYGDLNGIIEKLDYLKDLGIGAIYLTSIYKSSGLEHGYDIKDFYSIDQMYGKSMIFVN